jgi:hypothetical protein
MKLFHFIKKHWQLYNSWYPNGTANKSKWSLSWKKGDRRITFNYGGFYIGFGLYLSPFFKLWLFPQVSTSILTLP